MRRSILFAAAALFIAIAPGAPAAPQQPGAAASPRQLDPRAVVAEVRRILAERYVLPEKRPAGITCSARSA